MKIAVLGSGIVGVASAYYLAKAGHEVEVVDRQPEAARETSYANAGQVSWGYAAPWAAPGIPLKAVKWMFSAHAPLVIRPRLDGFMVRWLARMVANCTAERYAINRGRLLRLARHSQACLAGIRQETGLRYDERTLGTLQVFRDEEGLAAAALDMKILDRFGIPYRLLDREGCVAVEPALAITKEKIAGGLHLPGDETGDCFIFTQGLATEAERLGVRFRFSTSVSSLEVASDRIVAVETDRGPVRAEAIVVAMGSYSAHLLRKVGIHLPVYPVKGYSATVPVLSDDHAPRSTIMDEAHKIAVTRLGNRIRAAGTAELTGFDTQLRLDRCGMIRHVIADLFPRGGALAEITFWTGLRPMTPDGTPVIGPTRYKNLFLNTGHGTLGWTMGCGSGQVLADLISGRRPEIDVEGLMIDRYAA